MRDAEATCGWVHQGGYRQEVAFTAGGVFTVVVVPLTDPVGGVLVCPPVADDLVLNYRREVILARRLAQRGVLTVRFQYRGTGNSLGDADHVGWPEVLDDAGRAYDELIARCGPLPIAFFGTRLGGLVAASLASTHGPAPLAAWDPVVEVATYVREVARLERIVALGGRAGTSDAGRRGAADLAARRVPAGIVRDRDSLTLSAAVAHDLDAVFLASLVGTGRTKADAPVAFEKFARTVEAAEFDEAGWWPTGVAQERDADEPWPVVDATVEFLARSLAEGPR